MLYPKHFVPVNEYRLNSVCCLQNNEVRTKCPESQDVNRKDCQKLVLLTVPQPSLVHLHSKGSNYLGIYSESLQDQQNSNKT